MHRRPLFVLFLASALAALLCALASCSDPQTGDTTSTQVRKPEPQPQPVDEPAPARGVILISIDTLRADHVGTYGAERGTTPRLDALAERGVVFERAYAQAPSTLISHMSIFTSLFPPQHGVKPPEHNVLSTEIPTLPERFAGAGYRTAGHTEGGYMEGDHGFARGFGTWTDPGFSGSTDIESTFAKGLAFLESVGDEPFFLFLHTYSVHDPYEPPDAFRHRHWQGETPTDAPASAETLEAVNDGRLDLDAAQAAYYAGRYDDGIVYADQVLGRFVDRLDALGLLDRVTLVITSDHGEEFLDHRRMLHTQVYPELLHVPLVVLHPGLVPRRVWAPVRSVDLAPTLLDLADLPPLEDASGRSLMAELTGHPPDPAAEPWSYADVAFVDAQRALFVPRDDRLYLLVERTPLLDPDGAWIHRSVRMDVDGRRVGLRLASFHTTRALRVDRLTAEGGRETLLERALPPEWTDLELRLPGPRVRLELSVDGCTRPVDVGLGDDPRCLGFMIADRAPTTHEVFDLDADPGATRDLSLHDPALLADLLARLAEIEAELRPVAAPGRRALSEEERKALEALGYL